MRRVDAAILGLGLAVAILWAILSGRDGYKGSNALIVARSISVTSTISGQVENDPPDVGSWVDPDDLLVRIHNGRQQTEFDAEIEFLQHEVDNATLQQQQLDGLLLHYQQKAAAHRTWMLRDVELRAREQRKLLEIARGRSELKKDQAARTAELFRDRHASSAAMDLARTEAQIAAAEVELGRTRLTREELLHRSANDNGIFFDNGDAGYWDKMVDSLTLRQLDNLAKLATLSAQLERVRAQADVEHTTTNSAVGEDHFAPFSGIVNATYVARGTRVTTGTSLLQVLDCTDPVVIVPLPEHRVGEFDVGMSATIYPVDSDDALSGVVEYISSGPQIGNDQALSVQEQLTSSGVHAVVGFSGPGYGDTARACESTHRAIVVIHNHNRFGWGKKVLAQS